MIGTIIINKKWFDENKQKFLDEANKRDYNEVKDSDYKIDVEIDNNEYFITEQGRINVVGGTKSKVDDVWISLESEPDMGDLIRLAQLAAKQYNKVKTFFESLS